MRDNKFERRDKNSITDLKGRNMHKRNQTLSCLNKEDIQKILDKNGIKSKREMEDEYSAGMEKLSKAKHLTRSIQDLENKFSSATKFSRKSRYTGSMQAPDQLPEIVQSARGSIM